MYTNNMMRRSNLLFVAIAAALMARPGPATAHPAEQGFVLLLPTTAYTIAGTLSVFASMLLMLMLRHGALARFFSSRPFRTGAPLVKMDLAHLSSLFATVVLFGLISIGFAGPTDPQSNLMPLVFWTVFWIAVFVIQGTLFDIWRWINPWRGLAYYLFGDSDGLARLPKWCAAWPAVILFALFQNFMLADVAPNDPPRLAYVISWYWAINFAGVIVFGAKPWLNQVECITVMFNLLSRLRPITSGRIGMPGWQAVTEAPLDTSRAVFCLLLLAAGSFDGLNETFWWLDQLGINPLEFPGRSAVYWPNLIGLYLVLLILVIIYTIAIWVGIAAVRFVHPQHRLRLSDMFRSFAITLLPIGLGYHFAHYYVTFLVQIRVTLATLADPFALGWNLFGLNAVKVTTGFLAQADTVKIIWLTQAGAVVLSHVWAVLLGHRIAEKNCTTPKEVIMLQLGVSILMIFYTIFGLWLLASPKGG